MTVDFNPHYSYFNDDSIVLKLKTFKDLLRQISQRIVIHCDISRMRPPPPKNRGRTSLLQAARTPARPVAVGWCTGVMFA